MASVTTCYSQTSGQVLDPSGKPLPFATIKLGNTKEGVVADLNGFFELTKEVPFIEVSYLNYITRKIAITKSDRKLKIVLEVAPASLNTVIVKSTSSKVKRIMNNVVANRDKHNPDKFAWYRCNVYYKMVGDMVAADSILEKDTSKDGRDLQNFLKDKHLFFSETYSKRTWRKPASLQEQVIATRMSGFRKAIVSSLVTDFLPFHAYTDFINLNGREYNNPISKGLYQRFDFKLQDEILQGTDTVWIINFQPKKPGSELNGSLYINSDGFALAHFIAHAIDSTLRRNIGIEQQYARRQGRWFPEQLNYVFKWQMGDSAYPMLIKGSSIIDSVSFDNDEKFRFDKAHTTILLPKADEAKDAEWKNLRPVALQPKEAKTYEFIDSAADAAGLHKYMRVFEKVIEGKFPLTKSFDVNLKRVYSFNNYEKSRFGWGMQTSENVFRNFSVGGWAGYGTRDKEWKYGGFAEIYGDQFKEFVIKGAYYKDLRDPGRLQIHKDLDRDYIRMFLMSRVDMIEGWKASVQKRFGYLTAEVSASSEKVTPRYDYSFADGAKIYRSLNIKEATIGFRYAYGERSAPVFGKYFSTGSGYPIFYLNANTGIINKELHYTQATAAVSWQKNLNRIGKERFMLIAANTFSAGPLPLTKLFAGNGFLADATALYVFGGMQTMRPYEYYTDRFINFYWMHDFNLRLYRLKITKGLSSAPQPSVGYNVLWGGLRKPEVHQLVTFKVPEKPYQEGGLMLNHVLRMNLLGLYYISANVGYFHQLSKTNEAPKNGRFVFGMGVDL